MSQSKGLKCIQGELIQETEALLLLRPNFYVVIKIVLIVDVIVHEVLL